MRTFLLKRAGAQGLTGGILAFIGAIFVIFGTLFAGFTLLSQAGTVTAQGTIVSCADSGGSCRPIVSFQTLSGQQNTFRSSTRSSFFEPGKSVTVRYHLNDPQGADIDPWIVNGVISSIFAGFGLVLLVVGLLLFLFARSHPSTELITYYYNALKNQDYMTSFQCLNPGMMTPQGQQITQSWYIHGAQDYDSVHGRVIDYTIRGFSLSSTRGKFTIRVIRGEKSYTVYLHVLKEGDGWKINGFDLF